MFNLYYVYNTIDFIISNNIQIDQKSMIILFNWTKHFGVTFATPQLSKYLSLSLVVKFFSNSYFIYIINYNSLSIFEIFKAL